MNVVVFGNGLIGSQVAARLAGRGVDVVALSRADGVDTTTGKGVAEAVAGADVVVDVTNSPSWEENDVLTFFRQSTSNLLEAEKAAGVGHHVIVSIVGADRLADAGYMRAKVAQESLVEAGPIPYSTIRATQFFEFVAGIADAATVDGVVHASPSTLQPIASRDVAAAVVDVVVGAPVNGTIEVAGPQAMGIDELVRRLFAATGDDREVVSDPAAGYFGAELSDSSLTPTPGAGARLSPTSFDEWLAESS